MADVNAVADSSPAPDSTQFLASMTSAERSEWRTTGKIPEQPSTKQESAPADTSKVTDSVVADDAAKPEAEAGKLTAQEHKERKGAPGAEARIRELVAHNKELLRKLEAREAQKVTEAEPAKTTKPEANAEAAPKLLSPDEWFVENSDKTYEDYTDYRSEFRFNELKAKEAQAEVERKQQEEKQSLETSWKSRVDAAIEAHDDFKSVVTQDFNSSIKAGSVLDGWLIDSEMGAEIMYHFAKNPEEYAAYNALKTPFAQARKLTKLEDTLSGSASEAPKKEDKKAPAPPVTKAPPKSSEVGGRATTPADDVAVAAKDGDFRSFKELRNREDAERMKLRGR